MPVSKYVLRIKLSVTNDHLMSAVRNGERTLLMIHVQPTVNEIIKKDSHKIKTSINPNNNLKNRMLINGCRLCETAE